MLSYRDLLPRLAGIGLGEVGRVTIDGRVIAYIAKHEEAIVPFVFTMYPIYLDNGNQSLIDEEVIDALLRRFEVSTDAAAAFKASGVN